MVSGYTSGSTGSGRLGARFGSRAAARRQAPTSCRWRVQRCSGWRWLASSKPLAVMIPMVRSLRNRRGDAQRGRLGAGPIRAWRVRRPRRWLLADGFPAALAGPWVGHSFSGSVLPMVALIAGGMAAACWPGSCGCAARAAVALNPWGSRPAAKVWSGAQFVKRAADRAFRRRAAWHALWYGCRPRGCALRYSPAGSGLTTHSAVGPGENQPPAAGVPDPHLDGVESLRRWYGRPDPEASGKQCGRGRFFFSARPGCGSCACFLRQSSIAFRSAELHGRCPRRWVLRGQLRRCTAIGAWPDQIPAHVELRGAMNVVRSLSAMAED